MTNDSFTTFLHSEVPDFLRDSQFYLSLDDAEDEPISIPSNCARFTLKLKLDDFENDLRNLLKTFRFWGVDSLLCFDEFTTFILAVPNKTMCIAVLAEFKAEFNDEVSFLIKLLEGMTDEEALCMAISLGGLKLVQYMAAHKYVLSQSCLFVAAHHNQLDCLEFALANRCVWDPCVLNFAARQGHVGILRFAHEKGLEIGEDVCFDAASTGHLSCLQYAYENGHKWPNKFVPMDNLPIALYARSVGARWVEYTCCEAAKVGNTELLMYLHQGNDYHHPISNKALLVAVWMGHIDCIRYLRSIDIPWTGCECELAAYRGNVDTLKFLCESNCPRNELAPWVCTIKDNIDCLRYLHESDCPWDCSTSLTCSHLWTDASKACPWCVRESMPFYTTPCCINEIEHLGEFWYRQSSGPPQIHRTKPEVYNAYRACGETCPFGIAALCTYYKATRCLQYAFEQGCAWPDNPFHLPNLTDKTVRRCVYSLCQPWSAQTSANAAMCDTVNHLKTLHKNGCPWDKRTVMNALHAHLNCETVNGSGNTPTNLFCLRYAVRHNCPYEIEEVRAAIANNERYRHSKNLRKIFPWIEEDERTEELTRLGRKRLFFCTGAMLALAVAQVSMRAIGHLLPK